MPNNDSHHHVVKTTEQWQDRAVEYWVVPRGTLCVELTPEKKTKIKIGEGSKYYSQLPYICDGHDMSNYYTKEETDRLLDNLNRMAIQSTDVYDTKDDLPLDGNKLGDVRFVRSTSEQKVDPDVYLWNGSKWIYVGYDFANIDLDRYLTKTEFHSEFDPVKDKVDEMYPKMHTHDNKDVLDRTERPFTIADKEKLDSLENYDDTEIRELIRETGHVHWNKHILDTITEDKLWTVQDREKFESLHNYDDTELRNRMGVVESKAHTHTNKDILDQTTAPFKTEDKQKLDSLENYDIFIGTDGRYPGVKGLVPAPSTMDIGKFLSSSGEWELAGINTPFVGATPTTDGVIGLVPAPLMGEQSYYLRGDGTWAKVKSGGDKYKAGEGIYILSGEVATDTFPFQVYSRSGHLEQYIIYGNTGGVGDAMTGGVYGVNITITDEHGNSSNTSVILPEKISLGDYIDYGRQVFVHMRTNVSSLISSVDPSYNWRWAIRPDGSIQYTDIGAYGSSPQVTSLIELEPGITYELYHECNYSPFANYMNLNVYDTEQNRTRTMNFYDPVGNVPTIIALASNEKYIRLTYEHGNAYPYTLIRVKAVETPITLPQIPLFPNSINTINVTNTIKPAEIYVEVAEPSEDDPDDPMSDFTGIIYNDGVLDITQEDPNALNELTVHFRDNVDKVITIPETPLEPATTTTLGGIIVGENLTIDENGVLDATGGGTTYVEGDGIEFGYPVLETYQVLDKIRKPSGTTLTTDVMPSGTVDFFCDLKYYKYAGDSFLILCYDGERGSFCYTPAPTASGGWARMWIYTAHQNWYDLYLNGSFASSSPIVAHLRWGNTMSMSFDHTSTSAQNTPGVLPGHNRFKFDTSSDADLYWAKFYENSALVGELIPVIRQSDNVVGLFNTVTETFSTASGLTPGTPTGETIVIYDQSSTQNIPINAKLGDGLDFDDDSAIEVQPATTTTIGGIIVGENLTIDENGVLSANGGGGVLYDAGDGIEFTYNHMIDMLFDRTAFLDSVTSVQRGTISKDAVTGAFTITATGNDAYTYPDRSSLGTVYSIQVDPNTTYKLTWTSDDPTVHGNVFVFENGDIITSYLVDQATSNELTFITSSTCQTLNFRFGVQNSGDSLTYSDISLYKITEDATINAKLGSGLRFDANEAIEAIPYVAGTGIDIETYAPARLPVEYQEVEYIASDGVTQNYINTGIHQPMTVVIDMKYNTNATQQYMGWSITGKNRYFGVDTYSKYNVEETPGAVTGIDLDVTERRTITVSFRTGQASTMTIEGQTITNFTTEGSDVYTTNDFLLFTLDKTDYFINATIYEVTIYDTNFQLIFHGIPCYRVSDDVSGLYDLVSETFKPSIGGNLAVGPDVVPNNSYKIINTGLLSVEQDQLDPGHLTFETIDGDIDVNIPNNTYEAGTGINIISDSGSTVSRTLKVNAQTAQANDYTIYGASGGVGDPSINLMPQLTTSSIWADTWYADGTHEGEPAFSKNTWYGGITNEVYLTEGTYTFSLDVKLSSTSVQGLLANELNDQSRYPHYNQAATVDIMHYGPFYPVDTDWHRYSYTFEVTTAGYVACRAENVSAEHGTISVARPQLERGSVAHDYVEHDCYTIPITVSAPNETDIEVFIETSAPLGNGDSLNFIDDALPTLPLYQNKINTITVNTTVTPSRFAVDASSDSDVTSIIENDGVLDVTQEDPNALNELTFHYRDNVDKVITIPSTPLPIASDTTLGGIKVGDNLTIDQDGVLSATGGTSYTAGTGIQIGGNIIYNRNRNIPSETYRQVEYLASDGTGYILTDIVPTWQTWYQFRYRGSSDNTLPTGAVFGETAIVNGQYRNSQAFFDYYNGELRACELSGNDSAYGFYASSVASQIFQHDMVVNFADGSYNQFSLYTTDYIGDGRFANDSLVQHVGASNTGKGATTQALALFAVNTYDVTNDVRTFENRRGGRFYYLNKMEGGLDDARTTHYLLPCYRIADDTYGVRPVVSLTPGTEYTSGNGSMSDPYVVE